MTGLRWTDEQHQAWKNREAARSAAQQNANAAGGDGGLREGNGSSPAAVAPKAKYHNRKTNGYDSAKEAKRGAALEMLERAGQIRDLRRQVRFELVGKQDRERAAHYVADFVYTEANGGYVVEDTKGVRTRDYVLKRKLMLERYGIRIRET